MSAGSRPRRVVVTGSECTGKTTLAAWLAARLGAPLSPEYGRSYVAALDRPLAFDDVAAIADGQVAAEERAMAAATDIVVHDTDLLSTLVYSRHYFGAVPDGLPQRARSRRADLYLLHFPDVPWIADGAQRDRPHLREHMHRLFADELAAWEARVVEIRGSWDERQATAVAALAQADRR